MDITLKEYGDLDGQTAFIDSEGNIYTKVGHISDFNEEDIVEEEIESPAEEIETGDEYDTDDY